MTCKNLPTTQDKIYVFSASCLRSLRCIIAIILLYILYTVYICIYIYIDTLYIEMFSLYIVITLHSPWVMYALRFEDPGLPEWKLWIWWTIGIRNHSIWRSNAQFLHRIWNTAHFGSSTSDRYSCRGVARWHHGFVLRKKTKSTTLKSRWSRTLTPRGHQRSKLAFVFKNSSENKLGTLHVVQLFSSISVDLQAEWQLQLDTSALVPGHDSRSQMSLVLNVCYTSALRALPFFFTFVFCCHCLHPFCLFETRFVIVLSDLDSGQHYKLCLDMDGVSTALLPGQHSTQEIRRIEFCFFQYLKFKVTPRSCFLFGFFFP